MQVIRPIITKFNRKSLSQEFQYPILLLNEFLKLRIFQRIQILQFFVKQEIFILLTEQNEKCAHINRQTRENFTCVC